MLAEGGVDSARVRIRMHLLSVNLELQLITIRSDGLREEHRCLTLEAGCTIIVAVEVSEYSTLTGTGYSKWFRVAHGGRCRSAIARSRHISRWHRHCGTAGRGRERPRSPEM
jgi:hypothetical protein